MRQIVAQQRSNFPALTGIRAFAMYMVFTQHFKPFQLAQERVFATKLIDEFYVSLILFFVLSGFLITYRYYHLKERSLRTYIISRIARVYPMYFIITTITFILLPIGVHQLGPMEVYLLNITFLRGFFQDLLFTGVAQGWSLTPEEVFYFTAPFAFIAIRRNLLSLVILPVIIIALGFAIVNAADGGGLYGFMSSYIFMINYTFFGACFTFFAGVTLAILYLNGALPKIKGITALGGIICLVIMIISTLTKGEYAFATHTPLGIILNIIILPYFGIGLLLLGLITERTWFSRLLSTKPFVIIGESSLSFYLIHYGMFSFWLHERIQNIALLAVVLTILGLILHFAIERPANTFIKKLGGVSSPSSKSKP
jgi:peptidoglycan/LPS O-acetylase OafA/YrhL